MNDDHPADPVGRIAVHALPHLRTGNIDVESPGIQGGSHVLYPFNPFFNTLNDFVITGDEDDLSGAKIDCIHTVPDPIDIDQLSVQSDGIGAG